MQLVAIVTALALIQYFVLGLRVGQARTKFGIEAPAISGHPIFERHFRVHQNTMEQLVLFLPALWLFATYVSAGIAAALGVVFIIGRFVYARLYVAEPKRRGAGVALSAAATLVLLLGGLIGAVVHLLG
jgi:glutathione S-transferase